MANLFTKTANLSQLKKGVQLDLIVVQATTSPSTLGQISPAAFERRAAAA